MNDEQEICLALDTALESCSVGLAIQSNGATERFGRSLALGRGHAEHLMGELEQLLSAHHLTYKDLSRIAVTVGPGSFTGLRVGLATARALGLALDIPVIGTSTLMALALNAQATGHSGTVGCFIDARRNQIYGQFFTLSKDAAPVPATEAEAKSADAFASACQEYANLAMIGNGSALVVKSAPSLEASPLLASACPDMALLAGWALDQAASPTPPAPLYLRAPDAKPQASKSIPHL